MKLYSFGLAYSFKLFTGTFDVGDHYGDVPFCIVVAMVVVLVCVIVVPIVVIGLVVADEFVVPLVESPSWKLASL